MSLLWATMPMFAQAQSVSYTYKPLADEGCQMSYSIAKQDTNYCMVVTVSSDNMVFLKNPIFLIKTFKGDVIKLTGEQSGDKSDTGGFLIGSIIFPITEINSTAQFPITEDQLKLLNDGIMKVRLSTSPYEHERTFKKDKIGKKLYNIYLKKKEQHDNF